MVEQWRDRGAEKDEMWRLHPQSWPLLLPGEGGGGRRGMVEGWRKRAVLERREVRAGFLGSVVNGLREQ